MAQVKRFAVGLQAVLVLACDAQQRTSAEIAEQMQFEPTQLRKILAQLVEAGIVEVKQGRTGGYQLTRKPAEISLADIYRSLQEEEPRWHRLLGAVGSQLTSEKGRAAVGVMMTELQNQVDHVLRAYTLADLLE